MKKYERPEIKEVEVEFQPLLEGSDVDPQGPIGEDWQNHFSLIQRSTKSQE